MFRASTVSLALAISTLLSACSFVAPPYAPDIGNVQRLKNAGAFSAKIKALKSAKNKDNPDPIPMRANQMTSPYTDYAGYLTEALRVEMEMAGKLSVDAPIQISGTLLKNQVDPAISTGSGDISARFTVEKAGQLKYNQVKSIHHEWDSAFAAAIALPKAQLEYVTMVQKLLAELFADQAFIDALQSSPP